MFIHNLKYNLKILFKNKSLLFWTFAFPLIMATFFYLAFSSFEKNETFNPIDIAIIDNDELNNNQYFKEVITTLSDENSELYTFNTKYVTESQASYLLKDKKITGYIYFQDNLPHIIVNESNTNSTIIKSIVDEIIETITITKDLTTYEMINNPQNNNLYEKINSIVNNSTPQIKDTSSNKLSYITIEYYTLIAMTCLYGGTISMFSINNSLANMSSKGKRISISNNKKIITIISSLLASYIVQLLGVFLLLAYLYFIIKVDFGDNVFNTIITSIIGSLSGVSLGLFISCSIKSNEGTKIGIIIAISMACSFFSGMMGVVTKYFVDKNIPLLNKINPANMITDAFYSLYYYNTYDRFYFNIISLLLFSSILVVISSIILRRQKYDSI